MGTDPLTSSTTSKEAVMALKSDVRTGSIERELSNTTVSLSLAFPRGGGGGLSPV